MRALGLVLVALAIVNGALVAARRSASAERAVLVTTATELSDRAKADRASSARRRELDVLIERTRAHDKAPRDIGALRDVLVGAEQDLELDRLSLDFRPEDRLPSALGGSRVLANLRGRFGAVYEYLRRVEAMYLPLALDSLTLRGDPASVTLSVQWAARWPLVNGEALVELSPGEVAKLQTWLERTPSPHPERDVFSFRRDASATEVIEHVPSPELSALDEPNSDPAEPERPVLTGFVLARPELEPDVKRRVLAALRYDGEMRLVMVGDSLGAFVVDSMEARDSVILTRTDTGERVRLTLER